MSRLSVRFRELVAAVRRGQGEHGQVIVLFAFALVALLLVGALVLDVARVYTVTQYERSVADAAALAGAQDLQDVDASGNPTRTVNPADYPRAQCHAYDLLVRELTGSPAPAVCPLAPWAPSATTATARIGSYDVAITTPYGGAQTVDSSKAVKVAISQPGFALTFGNVVCLLPGSGCSSGAPVWSPTVASVAGLGSAPNYTIVALRPIKPRSGSSTEVRDIRLAGGAIVKVLHGDVGTNSNMDYASCSSLLDLETGYNLYYVDSPAGWGCPDPPGKHIDTMIPDPLYPIPAQPTTTYTTRAIGPGQAEDTSAACQALVNDTIIAPPPTLTTNYEPLVPRDSSGNVLWTHVHCMNPGTYDFELADNNNELTILQPGLYWFNQGLDVQSNLIGGYDPTQPGVTLWFRRDPNVLFKQRSGALVLNAGSRFSPTAAFNPGGTEPTTAPAMTGGNPNLKITVIVEKDPNCEVALPYNTGCSDLANNTIDLAGGTALYLAGVQYAPSDNVKISGNSAGVGYVGQIWAWTLYYDGNNTTLTQEGAQIEKPGVIRLDTACSPGVACP